METASHSLDTLHPHSSPKTQKQQKNQNQTNLRTYSQANSWGMDLDCSLLATRRQLTIMGKISFLIKAVCLGILILQHMLVNLFLLYCKHLPC